MSTATLLSDDGVGIQPRASGELHSVTRQPILDLRGRTHAFRLLFRADLRSGGRGEPTVRSIQESAAIFGLDKPSGLKRLTGGLLAFVNCGAEAPNAKIAETLPATLTVLEIAVNLDASSELISACEKLKTLGFRLALDNFTWQKQFEPLVEVSDYIKVDFGRSTPDQRRELLERLRGKSITMLAKNVKSQMDYRQAREEGFSLFEGYFFCLPVAKMNRRPPANQILRIEILQALQKHPMDLHKLSQLVKRDGPLAYQLLRLVNSPLFAMRQPVLSIQAAMIAVGEDALRRIATLAIASQFNGEQPAELLCMALVRGRFCELGAKQRGMDPFGQYLLGLLSLLPAMQGQEMKDVVPALPLSNEIREALIGTKNRERALLDWLESCECGDWNGCDAVALANGLNQEELSKVYLDAVAWAETALHSGGQWS
jgi:c-di-GMP phosphodiesterase